MSERNPPYHLETEQGDVLGGEYPSLGWCLASASKYVIDAKFAGSKDTDGSPIVALIVKDKDGNKVRRVTENYPAD
jgi:hypothetical protein